MTLFLLFVLLGAFIYGAYTDYKRREIENIVPIIIMAVSVIAIFLLPENSVLYIPTKERTIMLAVLGVISFIPNGIGGGDMKLLMATGFCFGFTGSLFILLLAAVESVALRQIKKMKQVPLASVMLLPAAALLLLSIQYEIF
jgi:Flp pilus assembly protein protease CpaA